MSNTKTITVSAGRVAVALALIAAVAAVALTGGSTKTYVIEGVKYMWLVVALFATIAVGYVASVSFADKNKPGASIVSATVAMLVVLGTLAYVLVGQSYGLTKSYATSLNRTDEPVPTFVERAPYQVAEALLERNRGDLRGKVTLSTALDGVAYSAIVANKKVNGVVQWDGSGNGPANFTTCRYEDGVRVNNPNGIAWNSLKADIRDESFGTGLRLNIEDIYGVCTDDGPVLYWPATRTVGFVTPQAQFAGLVIVGSDGDISFDRNVEAGEHPGPVYPLTLVRAQEQSIRATDGFSNYFWTRETVAFGTDSAADLDNEDDDSPSGVNTGQFLLATEDGTLNWVTPMVRKKGSRQIVAVTVTRADIAQRGELNDLNWHDLDTPRKANREISQMLADHHRQLRVENGLQVMEVVPRDDKWVGWIGRELVLVYRFEVTADGHTCLFDADTDRSLGCGGDEEAPGESVPTDEVGGISLDDLEDLSSAELTQVREAVEAELDSRLEAAESGR